MGSTVQDADDLPIALDGHPRDGMRIRELDVLDAHLAGEFAAVGVHQPGEQFGIEIVGELRHAAANHSRACRRPRLG